MTGSEKDFKQDSTIQSKDQARRKILRSIITGGSLGAGAALVPSSWTRPVVGTVLLPSHAGTSNVLPASPFSGSGLVAFDVARNQDSESSDLDFAEFVGRVRNAVISDANAIVANGGIGNGGGPALIFPAGFCVAVDVTNLDDPGSDVTVTVSSNVLGTDNGVGTLTELLGSGIITGLGYTVIATILNPDGTGAGTITGVPYSLSAGGVCIPQDRGIIGEGPILQF